MIEEQIAQAKQFIDEADAILITAGAGMGVDSGLPDFRGNEGFWEAYPAIKALDVSFQEMANPSWFAINPPLAWAFYGHRLNLYRKTMPHDGFKLLLELVQNKGDNYFIFTSNVDGQFQKAGFSKEKILEVHGSIHHFQCSENCTKNIWDADVDEIEVDMNKFEATDIPLCPSCGDIARPNILMFLDGMWNTKRVNKQRALYNKWIKSVRTKKVVIIEIGAGTSIPTVRNESNTLSRSLREATLIRINPRDFEISQNLGLSIPFGGLEGIKKVLK